MNAPALHGRTDSALVTYIDRARNTFSLAVTWGSTPQPEPQEVPPR
ncbi:hypothetical protein [Micromonospora haikouensis]